MRTAYQAPNMNAFAERWVRSIKSELLDRRIFFGSRSLEKAIADYHEERPHQGIGNECIDAPSVTVRVDPTRVAVDERQGRRLKSYRAAA